jgi:hypothetical protein
VGVSVEVLKCQFVMMTDDIQRDLPPLFESSDFVKLVLNLLAIKLFTIFWPIDS